MIGHGCLCFRTPRAPSARRLALLVAGLAVGLAASERPQPTPADEGTLSPAALARAWDAEHVSPPLPPLLRHAELVARLGAVQQAAPDLFRLEEIGRSVEGRQLYHLAFGRGPFRVLLWSQMHGDEPTATAALLDVYEYVRRHQDDPPIRRLLDRLTVHTVPMLNPDGAERFERRNAQGIDINRDALLLQTPEGRALKALRDRLAPPIGFNLHNQNWRTSVGRPPQPGAISLLAVPFDEERRDNPGRRLAKQTCAVIRDALEPFAPGRLGRYDDTFEPRAFGDNLTRWGTSVVLIESGAWNAAGDEAPLVRLNFVALLTALDALASGRVRQADPARYETLPENEARLFYRRISGATLLVGPGIPPFTGDVGIGATRSVATRGARTEGEQAVGEKASQERAPGGGSEPTAVKTTAGRDRAAERGDRVVRVIERIEDLGDLRVYGALEEIDGRGLTVVPAFGGERRVGDTVRLPARLPRRLVPGAPANLFLLRPLSGGRYRVERIVTSETMLR